MTSYDPCMGGATTEPLGSPVRVYVEVTDTLSISYTTGIQRVVRELVTQLDSDVFPDIEVVPVFMAAPGSPYRRLTVQERDRLVNHPAGGAAGRRADSFGVLAPLVRVVGDTKLVYRIRIASRHLRARLRERRAHNESLTIPLLEAGSVFLDMEGSWFDPEPRGTLLPRLAGNGVIVMTLVHDVMPVIFPEWFAERQVVAFSDWLDAHLRNSKGFLTNSRRTATDLAFQADERGIRVDGPIAQITLGADFNDAEPPPIDIPSVMSRFLLVVGTVEPRKNHRIVLEAWDRLAADHPDLGLVLVGKDGWMVEDLVERIRTHERFGDMLLWLGGIDDSELTWLYRNAFLTVVPSFYEGLGVPVIEALRNGCPVVSSSGGALPEAGDGRSELFDPEDLDALVDLIRRHLDDPDHHRRQRESAAGYVAPTWDEAAAQVAATIRSVVRNARTITTTPEDG